MKKLLLWGAGLEAEKFYFQYRKKHTFIGVIDTYASGTFHGLPIYKIDEIKKSVEYDCIVIATTTYEDQVAQILEEKGFRYGSDYCFLNDFEKQLCIIYGNCHMGGIEQHLMGNPIFAKTYSVKRFFVHEDASAAEIYPSSELLSCCKLLIAQDIRDRNKIGAYGYDKLRSLVSPQCTCIKVPNLYGMNLYFMQFSSKSYEYEGLLDEHKREECGDHLYEYVTKGIIGHRDFNIEDMLRKNISVSEIEKTIRSDTVYSKQQVAINFRKEMTKLRERESNCSIIISDYIEKNYRTKKLFYDPFHPADAVFREKARKILSLLGIAYAKQHEKNVVLDQFEAFVYECVYEALGLSFDNEYIKYNSFNYTLKNRMINLNEYIEQYKLWMK